MQVCMFKRSYFYPIIAAANGLKSRKKPSLSDAATESAVLSNTSTEISLNLENEFIIS